MSLTSSNSVIRTSSWREIAGIGNLLRHEYGRVDDRIMWRVVQRYLPELKVVVADMLNLQQPPKAGP